MDQNTQNSPALLAAEDFGDQRSGSRHSLLLVAQFRVAGEKAEQVRVRNISAGGLMAEYPDPLERGTAAEIEVRGIGWVSGRIAWSLEGRVGMAFDTAIDPALAGRATDEQMPDAKA